MRELALARSVTHSLAGQWMKTECRGKIRYVVRIFPLRIGFCQTKPVFESLVVGISIINIIINNELRAI